MSDEGMYSVPKLRYTPPPTVRLSKNFNLLHVTESLKRKLLLNCVYQ